MTDAQAKPKRPRKDSPAKPQPPHIEQPQDAEAYLSLVVTGQLPPDATRVRAASALIRYQRAVTRPPLASPPPRALAANAARDAEDAAKSEFERRAAEIRAKHKAKKPSAP